MPKRSICVGPASFASVGGVSAGVFGGVGGDFAVWADVAVVERSARGLG